MRRNNYVTGSSFEKDLQRVSNNSEEWLCFFIEAYVYMCRLDPVPVWKWEFLESINFNGKIEKLMFRVDTAGIPTLLVEKSNGDYDFLLRKEKTWKKIVFPEKLQLYNNVIFTPTVQDGPIFFGYRFEKGEGVYFGISKFHKNKWTKIKVPLSTSTNFHMIYLDKKIYYIVSDHDQIYSFDINAD